MSGRASRRARGRLFLRGERATLETLRDRLFRSYEEWTAYGAVDTPEEQRIAQIRAEDQSRSGGVLRLKPSADFGDADIMAWMPDADADPASTSEWARVKNQAQGEINGFSEGGKALSTFLRGLRNHLMQERERIFLGRGR